jgi:DNA-directed RNA polymerase subunit H (RpoH/RPB5)
MTESQQYAEDHPIIGQLEAERILANHGVDMEDLPEWENATLLECIAGENEHGDTWHTDELLGWLGY